MPTDITTLLITVGIAYVGAGVAVIVLADQKRDSIEEQLNLLYSEVQSKQLEPLLTQLIFQRKAQQNPTAYMTSPEVVEDLRGFKVFLTRYMNADGYREVLCFCLSSSGISLIVSGFVAVILTVANFFAPVPDLSSTSSLILIGGILMFFYFQRRYSGFSGKYFETVREIRRMF